MSTDSPPLEDELVHFLKNQLSIVLGFSDLMLEELDATHPNRHDIEEIRSAAAAAIARMPELAHRLERSGK